MTKIFLRGTSRARLNFFNSLAVFMILFSNPCFSRIDISELTLEVIDNICGDTWCEGEFDFDFREIKIDEIERMALVDFSLILNRSTQTVRHDTTCAISNVSSFDDVIEFRNGSLSLTDEFFKKLNLCISEREIVSSNLVMATTII